jgi:single-strand DNA-binding protein
MSGSLNLVVLIGRVGRDPEVRFTRSGDRVVSLSLATSERWMKDGQKSERTEWHRVEIWGATADFVTNYVAKGALVSVEGSLRTDEYTTDKGEKRKATKIRAKRVELLAGGKPKDETPDVPTPRPSEGFAVDDDESLPF